MDVLEQFFCCFEWFLVWQVLQVKECEGQSSYEEFILNMDLG